MVTLLIMLIGVGCRGAMEQSTGQPGERRSGRIDGVQGAESERFSDSTIAVGPVPGIYFLHDQEGIPDFQGNPRGRSERMEGCAYLAEHVTGDKDADPGVPSSGVRGEAGAVLELAERTRMLGGNVVLLPYFSEEYPGGVLTGRVYRCDGAARSTLHEQGASERRLTVVE